MVILTEQFKEFIKKDAKNTYPKECCGLILKNGQILSCKNTSETPEKSFIINSAQILSTGLDNIIAFYHSHKDYPDFSLADIAFSEKLKMNCIVYIVDLDTFKEYEPNGMELPYIGRPMFGGYLDCLSLFQDYYRRELNITFQNDVTHPLRYQHKAWTENTKELFEKYGYVNILEDYLILNNFIKVDTLKKYDILLFKLPNLFSPTHIAIFIGNNQILHHFYEYSDISSYTNAFKRLTVATYRHPSLS